MKGAERVFKGGHESFLYKGTNGRWREVLSEEDLEAYRSRSVAETSPGLRGWLEGGRTVGGDPKALPD